MIECEYEGDDSRNPRNQEIVLEIEIRIPAHLPTSQVTSEIGTK
jgi:hypothetical protein